VYSRQCTFTKIISISQNCALWNSHLQITTYVVLYSQCPPSFTPSQSCCYGVGGWARPDQMAIQSRADEVRPTTYQRSVDLPQVFGCNPFDFVWSLPWAVSETFLHHCHQLSLVGQKSEDKHLEHYGTDCNHSNNLVIHVPQQMLGEGRC
jgi:hypothetical protein